MKENAPKLKIVVHCKVVRIIKRASSEQTFADENFLIGSVVFGAENLLLADITPEDATSGTVFINANGHLFMHTHTKTQIANQKTTISSSEEFDAHNTYARHGNWCAEFGLEW